MSKFFGIFSWNCTLVLKITFVAYQNDNDILVSMAAQLFQPTGYVIKGLAFGYVINQHCPNSTPVVCTCNRSISEQNTIGESSVVNTPLVYVNRSRNQKKRKLTGVRSGKISSSPCLHIQPQYNSSSNDVISLFTVKILLEGAKKKS